LQFTKVGKFLADRRTWLVVVAGVGGDMIIAYPGDWYTVAGVIVASSAVVIVRSLWNEHKDNGVNYNAHKIKSALEVSTKRSTEIIIGLTRMLERGNIPQQEVAQLSVLLATAHRIRFELIAGRQESAKAPKGGR
jgi:hypothetical protein